MGQLNSTRDCNDEHSCFFGVIGLVCFLFLCYSCSCLLLRFATTCNSKHCQLPNIGFALRSNFTEPGATRHRAKSAANSHFGSSRIERIPNCSSLFQGDFVCFFLSIVSQIAIIALSLDNLQSNRNFAKPGDRKQATKLMTIMTISTTNGNNRNKTLGVSKKKKLR